MNRARSLLSHISAIAENSGFFGFLTFLAGLLGMLEGWNSFVEPISAKLVLPIPSWLVPNMAPEQLLGGLFLVAVGAMVEGSHRVHRRSVDRLRSLSAVVCPVSSEEWERVARWFGHLGWECAAMCRPQPATGVLEWTVKVNPRRPRTSPHIS